MKKLVVFLCVVCFLVLSGCDYREIDRGYLVNAIGFSNTQDTAKIYIEAVSSSDVHDKPTERVLLTGEGKDLHAAFENLKASLTKPLYFEQLGTSVFEKDIKKEQISFLQNIPELNYGICLVKTDDIDALFNAETPNGILGYDIMGLLKTNAAFVCRLYQINRDDFTAPVVNFADGKMIFNASGVKK